MAAPAPAASMKDAMKTHDLALHISDSAYDLVESATELGDATSSLPVISVLTFGVRVARPEFPPIFSFAID